MKVAFPLLILLVGAFSASAQTLSPIDSSTQVRTTPRPLPPSMLAELHRSQKNRTLIYHDTIHGSDLTRQHFNDSVAKEYSDSAIAVFDTAVSLPHKEWLDSELVEIPELSRFGSHVHFNYPPSIMTETDLTPVPFDSTLVEHMNPVILENLPFFDQSPIPMPLVPARRTEAFIEAGGGNVSLPILRGWFSQSLSPHSVLQVHATFHSFDETVSAISNYGNIDGTLGLQLGSDPALDPFYSSALSISAGYRAKTLNKNSKLFQSPHDLYGVASIVGDASDQFHYSGQFDLHSFSYDLPSEVSEDVDIALHYDPYISHFRLIGETGFSRAAVASDSIQGSNFFGSSPALAQALSGHYVRALFGRRKGEAIEWYGGVEYLGGSGIHGESYSSLYPVARVRIPLNARWELGANYEPQVHLATWREFATINPFYVPFTSSQLAYDQRSVTIDKINFSAFMNYALSPDDALRLEARVITRSREPIFEEQTLTDSSHVWFVSTNDTRRFEAVASGNFLLFTRDVLSASAEFHSATIVEEDRSIPYEPAFSLTAAYHFNSMFEKVHPILEYRSLARTDRTLNFVNAEVNANILPSLTLTVRGENLLGSASDFWTGFPEYPRSVWATVRYSF